MPGVRVRPTDDQRRTMRALSGYGVPHVQIATFIGIDAKSLRKHYRDELDRGMVEANIKVAQSLFALATVEKSVPAAIFWLKARAGWREKVELEHSGIERHGEGYEQMRAMLDGPNAWVRTLEEFAKAADREVTR